ncbi:hypothetical protein BGX28_005896 [Mortierella sp. GBA30]|nr:hypothetical protein BGX28_005896 [Mortierella sp. GBA30]
MLLFKAEFTVQSFRKEIKKPNRAKPPQTFREVLIEWKTGIHSNPGLQHHLDTLYRISESILMTGVCMCRDACIVGEFKRLVEASSLTEDWAHALLEDKLRGQKPMTLAHEIRK